jgi:hypothetical protein
MFRLPSGYPPNLLRMDRCRSMEPIVVRKVIKYPAYRRVCFIAHTTTFACTDSRSSGFVCTHAGICIPRAVQWQALRPQAAQQLLMQPGAARSPDRPGLVPLDFDCAATLSLCEQLNIPVFGVCLGLRAIVKYCGGALAILDQAVSRARFITKVTFFSWVYRHNSVQGATTRCTRLMCRTVLR